MMITSLAKAARYQMLCATEGSLDNPYRDAYYIIVDSWTDSPLSHVYTGFEMMQPTRHLPEARDLFLRICGDLPPLDRTRIGASDTPLLVGNLGGASLYLLPPHYPVDGKQYHFPVYQANDKLFLTCEEAVQFIFNDI